MLFHFGTWRWFPGGYLGVDIFFVLSGFLVASLLLAEWDQRGAIDIGGFYWRRFFRLAPAIVPLFAMYAVVTAYRAGVGAASPEEPAAILLTMASAATALLNWQNISGPVPYAPTHLWSVALEVQFYALAPLLLRAVLSRRGTPRAALKVILILGFVSLSMPMLLGDASSRMYFGSDFRIYPLLLGAALACYHSAGPQPAWSGRHASVLLGACLCVLSVLLLTARSRHETGVVLAIPLTAVATAILISACARPGPRSSIVRMLESSPLRYIGARSYGLYLWHLALFQWFVMGGLPSAPWSAVILFPASFAVAELSYRFVEAPASRWGRARLEARRRSRPALEQHAA